MYMMKNLVSLLKTPQFLVARLFPLTASNFGNLSEHLPGAIYSLISISGESSLREL